MTGENLNLTSVLRALPDQLAASRPTLKDILNTLGDRATALILLIFSIPAIVPTPGIPAGMVFGSALALIGIQMVIGARRVRLPPGIAQLRIGQSALRRIVQRAAPHLERLERHLNARMRGALTPLAVRGIGFVIFIMAILIALPIPFGNTLPGLAVLALSLGLARQDGVAVLAGLGLAIVACSVSVALIGGSLWLFGAGFSASPV